MPSGTALFLDTTIQIASFVHSPEQKERIAQRLGQYDITVTGLVVRQEFRRRLLKEARYLLSQLEERGSMTKVRRHVIDHLHYQQRKRNICLELLQTVDEEDGEADKTKRLRLFLRNLLKHGLREFDDSVDCLRTASGCACGQQQVREIVKYRKYDFGIDKCSKSKGDCGIRKFLEEHRNDLEKVQEMLKSLPLNGPSQPQGKPKELQKAEKFIKAFLTGSSKVEARNPCLGVGDLMIAMESVGIPSFYTMNGKESQHLCRALGQDLIVRKQDPTIEDVICAASATTWQPF